MKTTQDNAIGERIRLLREERELSTRELAERAGFGNRSMISRFECGIRLPNADHLQSLSQALGVSITYLISGRDAPTDIPEAQPGSPFLIRGKPKSRSALQVFTRNSETVRRLARQYGLNTPELVHQMLDYCLKNMSL